MIWITILYLLYNDFIDLAVRNALIMFAMFSFFVSCVVLATSLMLFVALRKVTIISQKQTDEYHLK